MIHNGSKDPVINMVNYLANSSGGADAPRFYAFIEVADDPYWTWKYAGKNYAAVSYREDPVPDIYSDDDPAKEQVQIDKGRVWVVSLGGSDNTSYIKRFHSKKKMLDWMLKTKLIKVDESYLWWNS